MIDPMAPPRPPPSTVPPRATAAKICNSIERPISGSADPVWAETKAPAAP